MASVEGIITALGGNTTLEDLAQAGANTNGLTIDRVVDFAGARVRYGANSGGVIWFVLNDVKAALDISSTHMATRLRKSNPEGVSTQAIPSPGGSQTTSVVSEDVVYSYIVPRSLKPAARVFRRYMGRVMRTIRQTGRFEATDGATAALAVQRRQIAAEERRLDMDLIRFVSQTFGNDARLMFLAREKAASLMAVVSVDPQAADAEVPLTTSELMERSGRFRQKEILSHRVSVGRLVARKYRRAHGCEPATTQKHVGGHVCAVKVYPAEHHDQISELIEQFADTRLARDGDGA